MDSTLTITFWHLMLTVIMAVTPVVALTFAINASRRKEFNKIYDDKADKEATNEKFKTLHSRINEKADKSAIEQMSSKIDMIYKHVVK